MQHQKANESIYNEFIEILNTYEKHLHGIVYLDENDFKKTIIALIPMYRKGKIETFTKCLICLACFVNNKNKRFSNPIEN